ncbi:MAG: HD domain-containing protein [Anaerolineales bacterium]|nr:HD domain-containing protein [Anaerolineales bacterium]
MEERIARILTFLEMIDPYKSIERASYLSDQSRHETDSDHAWHMALFALMLHKELDMDIDIGRVLAMISIHDLAEMITGDTFAYAEDYTDKKDELAAAEQLFVDLPSDLAEILTGYWIEFTHGDSPEAQFARALDRLQAMAQNVISNGLNWQENGVTEEMSRALNREALLFDPAVTSAFEELYRRANEEGIWVT